MIEIKSVIYFRFTYFQMEKLYEFAKRNDTASILQNLHVLYRSLCDFYAFLGPTGYPASGRRRKYAIASAGWSWK